MSSPYAAERYDPSSRSLMHFSSLSLYFNGTQLILSCGGDRSYSYPAVSGNAGHERMPEGKYWINPAEMTWYENPLRMAKMFWGHFGNSPDSLMETAEAVNKKVNSWGRWRITIHPFTTTKVGDRGGFFIHGGNVWGSAGCIDLAWYMNDFERDLMKSIPGGLMRNGYIELDVDYS